MQQHGQVHGFLGGQLVLRRKQQHAVVEEHPLLAARHHGGLAIARGLHGQHVLARKARGGERPLHRGTEGQGPDRGSRRQAHPRPPAPEQDRTRSCAAGSPEQQDPSRRQVLGEQEMEEHAGDGRAGRLGHVDGQALPDLGRRGRRPREGQAAERARRHQRRQGNGQQHGQRRLAPERVPARQLDEPQGSRKQKRREREHDGQPVSRGGRRTSQPAAKRARQRGQAEPRGQDQPEHQLVAVGRRQDLAQKHHLREQRRGPRDRDGPAYPGQAGLHVHTPGIVCPQYSQRPFLMCMPSSSNPRRATTVLPHTGQRVSSPSSPGTLPV